MDDTQTTKPTDLAGNPETPLKYHTHDGVDSPLINKAANGLTGTTYGRMYLAGSQNIPTTTITKIALDTTSYSANITADTTNHRFTATVAGFYFVTGRILYISQGAANYLSAFIYLNGSAVAQGICETSSTSSEGVDVNDLVQLNVGDYVELFTSQFNGTQGVNPGSQYTYFSIFKI